MDENKKYNEIELRSEELDEVMEKMPPWILRRGITLLFVIIVVIITGSGFFYYPDVVIADMALTGRHPVAQIVSRSSGKMSKLYVTDGQEVKVGAILAVIENPASTEDILFLKQLLQKKSNPNDVINAVRYKTSESKDASTCEHSLGDIQSYYTSFQNSLNEHDNYFTLEYYAKKIKAVREQINKYRVYYESQKNGQKVKEEQYKLAAQQYARDSSLLVRGVISPSEHDNAKSAYLQSRYALEDGYAALENLVIKIGEMETNLLDLELQQTEKENVITHNYSTAAEQLINAINSWELNYCLTTPIDGNITFVSYWNENQFVQSGENVFTVVPDEKNEIIGKALLPIARSGKVKIGQKVIVRFLNYPDHEFGIVTGMVSSISLVPQEGNYQVEISFPYGLTTSYGKMLPVTFEMKASAEIITESMSLLQRFVLPMRKMLKEGFTQTDLPK
jgi:hypothetical protein